MHACIHSGLQWLSHTVLYATNNVIHVLNGNNSRGFNCSSYFSKIFTANQNCGLYEVQSPTACYEKVAEFHPLPKVMPLA